MLEAGEDAVPRSGEVGVGPVAEVVLAFQFAVVRLRALGIDLPPPVVVLTRDVAVLVGK
jgi:hypothetical protein